MEVKVSSDLDLRFRTWWEHYPRKVDKGHARKAFFKIAPDDAMLAKMLKALEWQRRSEGWVKEKGKYIPHPTTYLHGERWDDQEKVEIVPVHPETVYKCYVCGKQKRESQMKSHPQFPSEHLCKEGCKC